MTQTPEPPNDRIDRLEAALGRFALLTKLGRSQTITKGLTKFWNICLGSPATGEGKSSSNLLKCAIALSLLRLKLCHVN